MARETIPYSRLEDFPFEGIVFMPSTKNGEVYDGADMLHYKNGRFLTYPFDKSLDNVKIYGYYIMEHIK